MSKVWNCDCSGYHYLTVNQEPYEGWTGEISVEDWYRGNLPWKERFKLAWKILSGQENISSEVLLTKDTAREIAEELVKCSTP